MNQKIDSTETIIKTAEGIIDKNNRENQRLKIPVDEIKRLEMMLEMINAGRLVTVNISVESHIDIDDPHAVEVYSNTLDIKPSAVRIIQMRIEELGQEIRRTIG